MASCTILSVSLLLCVVPARRQVQGTSQSFHAILGPLGTSHKPACPYVLHVNAMCRKVSSACFSGAALSVVHASPLAKKWWLSTQAAASAILQAHAEVTVKGQTPVNVGISSHRQTQRRIIAKLLSISRCFILKFFLVSSKDLGGFCQPPAALSAAAAAAAAAGRGRRHLVGKWSHDLQGDVRRREGQSIVRVGQALLQRMTDRKSVPAQLQLTQLQLLLSVQTYEDCCRP